MAGFQFFRFTPPPTPHRENLGMLPNNIREKLGNGNYRYIHKTDAQAEVMTGKKRPKADIKQTLERRVNYTTNRRRLNDNR